VAYQVIHRRRAAEAVAARDRPDLRRTDVVLRALDLLIAASVLLVTSPLLLLFALAIKLSSGSPVLYRGARVGRDGRVYRMYKFRTLAADAETRLGKYYGPELTVQTVLEVTRLGRVMRVTQLDELPQLFNVIKGDMSVVGPRPIRPVFFEELSEQIPSYWQRLVVRPGLTGFAQVRMGREETWAEKLSHDLEYIADRSVGLYLVVAFSTGLRLVKQSIVDSVALIARRR
jgi:lipopolysaccharide/colanic/teichoic acid biosynthesis glycosyltransferase